MVIKMKFSILFSILVIKPVRNVHNNQFRAGKKVALIPNNCDSHYYKTFKAILHPRIHTAYLVVSSLQHYNVRGFANKFRKSQITTEVGGWVQVSLGKI